MPATPELAQYTTDFWRLGAAGRVHPWVWRLPARTVKIILCIHNKAPNPGLAAETLRKTFESEGVAVLEAEDLD